MKMSVKVLLCVIYSIGFAYFSTSAFAKLTEIDTQNPGGTAQGVCKKGDVVYFLTSDHLVAYVSRQGQLTQIDTKEVNNGHDIFCSEKFVYIIADTNVEVYEPKSLGQLTLVSSTIQSQQSFEIWSDDKFAYVANGFGGVQVYSVDDVGSLTFCDADSSLFVSSVWSDDEFVYTADLENGIHVYSVGNNGQLTHLNSDVQSGRALSIWGDGKFIYLANHLGGLIVYSVSDIGELIYIDSDEDVESVAIYGDGKYIYSSEGYNGKLYLYTVNSAGELSRVDQKDFGWHGHIRGIAGDEKFVYLAKYLEGIGSYKQTNVNIVPILSLLLLK